MSSETTVAKESMLAKACVKRPTETASLSDNMQPKGDLT